MTTFPSVQRHNPATPGGTRVYLDANASDRTRPEAREACLEAIGSGANPASVHGEGRAARRLLEESRARIASLARTAPDRVVLTSGGTEAAALALHGLGAGRRILIGATEHEAVRAASGSDAVAIPVASDGRVRLEALERLLADPPGPAGGSGALVCLMAANNETGVLHPIADALALCRRHGARLFVDAVQLPGRMALPDAVRAADAFALSGHKMGGVPGAGALVLGAGVELERPLVRGGGQELGRRGGTPGLAAIAAFGAACTIAPPTHLAALRDRIEAGCVALGAVALGAASPRLPNTTCLALPGRAAASQLIALDLAGFAVSAGAACSSGRIGPSDALVAMGAGPLAGEAIRVSLPWDATDADADSFLAAWAGMAGKTLE